MGGKDRVVCATNDFHVLDAQGRAGAGGDCELAATSCGRYHTVVEGLKAARDGLRDDQPVPLADIKAILARTQFGWTVHAAVFETGGKSIRWV